MITLTNGRTIITLLLNTTKQVGLILGIYTVHQGKIKAQ